MKKLFLSIPVLILAFTVTAQNVNIPDTNFKSKLISLGVDSSGDGEISYAEAEVVSYLDIGYSNISDLTGIEAFINLTTLACYSNQLTSIDVSNNTALLYLSCGSNQLNSLDVSNNTALVELYCFENQLTSLDVLNNIALETIECTGNQLTSLDVSMNAALFSLGCYDNKFTSLDVSNNTALLKLGCSNNQLTSIDVSNNNALKWLWVDDNKFTSLDVSNNIALIFLTCDNNKLTSIDVSNNTVLEELYCYNNQLTSLDVSQNNKLEELDLGNMPTLYEVCVWVSPFPPPATSVYIDGSPNIYFTTNCTVTMNKFSTLNTLNIYPNPVKDLININNADNTTLEIMNTKGQLIFSKELNSNHEQIDISNFNKGIYFVKVQSGESMKVEKLLIQ